MPGPLPDVDTKVAAPLLDVDRGLTMGPGVVLGLYVPDSTAAENMRLVRAYDHAFNRITEDETEGTIVFHIADVFPAGQVAQDLAQKELHLRWSGDRILTSLFCKVQEVDSPSDSEGQLWVVTAQVVPFRKAYLPR